MNTRQRLFATVLFVATLGVGGCASQAGMQLLNSKQDMAIQTALNKARPVMHCPEVSGMVLTRKVVSPEQQTPIVSDVPRAEYTIEVRGCGERSTVVVICPEGRQCFPKE